MKKLQWGKLFVLLGLFLCLGLVFAQRSAQADSNGALDVTLNGVYGQYKLELFQVGAPYPSRQFVGNANGWTGCYWSNLVTSQTYFVRATRLSTGQARQTVGFRLIEGRPGAIALGWNSPNFITYVHDIN